VNRYGHGPLVCNFSNNVTVPGQTILLERKRIKRKTIQNRRLLHRNQAA
jgi:hypothetical protein